MALSSFLCEWLLHLYDVIVDLFEHVLETLQNGVRNKLPLTFNVYRSKMIRYILRIL